MSLPRYAGSWKITGGFKVTVIGPRNQLICGNLSNARRES